jgi:GNAT superfamily N-acetyltransferase
MLNELLAAHRSARPHDELAFLAVAPSRQRAGLGRALLRHHHDHLDEAGVHAYVTACTVASRSLFLDEGYQRAAPPFRLPDADATGLYPMKRPPHPVILSRITRFLEEAPGGETP